MFSLATIRGMEAARLRKNAAARAKYAREKEVRARLAGPSRTNEAAPMQVIDGKVVHS